MEGGLVVLTARTSKIRELTERIVVAKNKEEAEKLSDEFDKVWERLTAKEKEEVRGYNHSAGRAMMKWMEI